MEDFSSGELQAWIGDTDAFIIDEDLRLQLMDSESGSSTIFIEVSYPDSITWSFDIELDFSPSNSNNLQLILATDKIDLSTANGYVLEIGENGSNDAINFIELENGEKTIIASGILGNVSTAFNKSFELKYDSSHRWTLITKEKGSLTPELEFEITEESSLPFSSYRYFGISCSYTTTRADKFFFDNIVIKEIIPDNTPPELVSTEILGTDSLVLTFTESLDETCALSPSNYSFSNNINIVGLEFYKNQTNQVLIIIDQDFPKGINFSLNVSDIKDQNHNILSSYTVRLFIHSTPSIGSILINEILFDPYPDQFDYVEIVNISDLSINLQGLIVTNQDKDERVTIMESLILEPDGIIALTKDSSLLIENYKPPSEARFYEINLPSYNNSDGNVSLLINNGNEEIILDSFDYEEGYHLQIYSDTEGISLERISFVSDSNDSNNWTSASEDANYGTPGYENSARLPPTESSDKKFFLEHKTFTPNADGDRDFMILNYQLDRAGYILNAAILDDHGRHEKDIAVNKTIGTNGFIRWDGLRDDNTSAPVGMYIVYYEVFHPDGEVMEGKEVVVLGKALN